MSDTPTTVAARPATAVNLSNVTSPERPMSLLSVVETLPDGFQQLSPDECDVFLTAGHIASEVSWWRGSLPSGSSGSEAFDRARAAERDGVDLGQVA